MGKPSGCAWTTTMAARIRSAPKPLQAIAVDGICGSLVHAGASTRNRLQLVLASAWKQSLWMVQRVMRSCPNSWLQLPSTMGIQPLLESSKSETIHLRDVTKNIEIILQISMARSPQPKSYTMEQIATSLISSTKMEFDLHLMCRQTTGVRSLVAKDYRPVFVTMTANFARRNMNGAGVTCLAWASTWQIWHRKVTGTSHNQSVLEDQIAIV